MTSNKTAPGITYKFNLLLLAYLALGSLASSFFEPEKDERVPWEAVYAAYPVLSIVLALLVCIVLLMCGAKLCQIFWEEVIADVFRIRPITYQEALSMVLVFSILVSSC